MTTSISPPPASGRGKGDEPGPGRPGVAQPRDAQIGLVGEHPAGFDTCRYDPGELAELFGVEVTRFALRTSW